LAGKEKQIKDLEKKTAAFDFWQNSQKAAEINQQLAELKNQLQFWPKTESEIDELIKLIELAQQDEKLIKEIEEKYKDLEKKFSQQQLKIFLAGPYDSKNAVISILAGAGGTEAQDWVEMLLRMYLRYADKKAYPAKVWEISAGQEAGIKHVTLVINASYAYGYLKGENGVHRLVRLSPFNADNLRHTSFALVEVLPEFDEIQEIEIKPADLRIDTYRASGPGGQYVNKTESAVRITHLPTNIVAACQSERLQGENKKKALKLLYTKLHQYLEKQHQLQKNKVKGKQINIEWGSQIRSYVLAPYQMVKDLRTGIETSDSQGVLDGDLDKFIEAEIRALSKNHDKI